MKLSHAIILIALLTSQFASLAFGSAIVNGLCQFDKSTMIKEKLKKGQECINNGNYSGAKNYLNGVLKLDSNNAKAKELLAVCNNEGKPVTSPRSNSSSLNSNNSNRNNSYSSALYVSKTELSFSSYGGTESLTVTSGASWSISVNSESWIKSINFHPEKVYFIGIREPLFLGRSPYSSSNPNLKILLAKFLLSNFTLRILSYSSCN